MFPFRFFLILRSISVEEAKRIFGSLQQNELCAARRPHDNQNLEAEKYPRMQKCKGKSIQCYPVMISRKHDMR